IPATAIRRRRGRDRRAALSVAHGGSKHRQQSLGVEAIDVERSLRFNQQHGSPAFKPRNIPVTPYYLQPVLHPEVAQVFRDFVATVGVESDFIIYAYRFRGVSRAGINTIDDSPVHF